MAEFYISSNKYNIQERKTIKNGTVYDIYFYVVQLDGTEKQKKFSGFKTKQLAKQAYLEFVTTKCELVKNNPIKKKNTKKEELTISQLFPIYIASIGNQNKDSVIYEKQNVFKRLLLPRFKDYTLKQLTTEKLYQWQDELWASKNPKTNEYYSYKHLTKIRTMLSAFLTWCETRYGYPNNLLKVKKPKRRSPQKKMQFWTKDEFLKFIKVVDKDIEELNKQTDKKSKETVKTLLMYRTFFFVLFYTGRRKGEALAIGLEDVKSNSIIFDKSLTRKTLTEATYEITSTKTERQDATPICPALAKELKLYKGQSPFFFGGEKPIAENTLTRFFNKYSEMAGNKIIRIHDLRHSFVSMMIHLGAPLTVVANLIGDTLAQVTQTYAHLYEEDKLTYLNKLV
ncbi:MAG: site-specific integrase [Clostridia bacterium]|nr:site-specific integrase [Clostridia bacterium]